jgi:hypothetical protein
MRLLFTITAVISVVIFFVIPQQVSAASIGTVSTSTTTLSQYEKLELTFTVNGNFTNPFNPDDIKVDGHFTSPSNKTLIQPAFFSGNTEWKIRFSPKETGSYSYYVTAVDSSGTTQTSPATFSVTSSANPGFIRISTVNPRYFQFENGQQFLGIGLNVSWQGVGNNMVTGYERHFNLLKQNGGNLARVWMVNSLDKDITYVDWIMTLQNKTLGRDYDLTNAQYFDQVISLAENYDIYLDLTFDDVVQFDSGSEHWQKSFYNSSNGGPVSDPCAIFTNSTVKNFQKQLYRYIVARWGYSPAIYTWELFNEVNEFEWQCTGDYRYDDVKNWHSEMGQYIRSIDAHNHLVNTSTGSYKAYPDLYSLTPMSYGQIHFYYTSSALDYGVSQECRDIADCIRFYSYHVLRNTTRPGTIGEYGLAGDTDSTGIIIHHGNWAGIMSGLGSTAWAWYWEKFTTYPVYFSTYKSISLYMKQFKITSLLSAIRPANVDETIMGTVQCPAGSTPPCYKVLRQLHFPIRGLLSY